VKPGEAHAIFGKNGAGKSTLIKIISGDIQPSSGEIYLNQEKLTIQSLQHAKSLGISAIFQEFSLIPQLTVEENLCLDSSIYTGVFNNKKKMRVLASKAMERLGFFISPSQKIINLSRAERKMVEIAKAFLAKPSLMILDEPTTSLMEFETTQLFSLIKNLKDDGVGVIYITHRMKEIYEICDKISVMKDGCVMHSGDTQEINEEKLTELATGQIMGSLFPKKRSNIGRNILDIKNLNIRNSKIDKISIKINAGEIVGLAGLSGSGRSEIAKACFGICKIKSGSITYLDDLIFDSKKAINEINPRTMLDRGVLYTPSDRRSEGLVMNQSIRENISLPSLNLAKFSRGLIVNKSNERNIVEDIRSIMGLDAKNIEHEINQLSGGTQQKVMLAKSLARDVQLFILDDPTVGVDVEARSAIYNLLQEFCESGGSVLLISSDVSELACLSNRVCIVNHGKVSDVLYMDNYNEGALQEKIALLSEKVQFPKNLHSGH
jgi:ribose transport system ATP-binding protein